MAVEEKMKFDAEVGKILQLMIHSLYTNKDIFLRELISNASDACDKLRYLSQTSSDLLKEDPNLKISIIANEKDKTITITDNGIGMNKQDLIENLGTIARSGTQNFLQQFTGDSKKDIQLIGQFGVGFYSAFMVAERVVVISRKAGEQQAWKWESKADGEYTISLVDEETPRGTKIVLFVREGEEEYLDKFRIKHIIKTYSDHISLPIEFVDEEGKSNIINSSSALWMRHKSDITPEQYKDFYKNVAYAPDDPWLILHNKNEGTIEYTNLLFIPTHKPFDLFHPDRKTRVKLYVKKVYITDEGVDLIPSYLRFIRGIIDSEDLPLNISRETLQHNHVIEKIKKSVTKRVISELKKKLEKERISYEEFWNNFGAVLKEGLCEGIENRENLLEICLFKSALTDKLISLDEYISNMQPGQECIYYLSGEDPEKLKSSPQLEGFISKEIDVLLFTDTVDDFWVNVERLFKDKEIKSVTRAGIELDKIEAKENETIKNESDKEENYEELLNYFKVTLDTLIQDVKISHKLVDSPTCLTVPEGAMDIRMERFLREQKQLKGGSFAKVLEINIKNPLVKKVEQDIKNKTTNDTTQELVKLLFDQACIIEGEPINDTGAFCRRLNNLLEKTII